MMSFTRNLLTPLVSRRLFSTTVAPHAYYTSTLVSDQHKKVNSNAKLYDFRSDTVTAPTDEMFDLMKYASRNDDVFQEDKSVNDLQDYMAELTGHEAALFCASGTMTNQLALRTHLVNPPHSVVCDHRAHVFLWEAGGIAIHSRASVSPVIASNGIHITADEIKANLLGNDIYSAPTRVVSLENTLNGMIFPIEEIAKISQMARQHGLAMHLDGARLWNASQETGIPLKEYGKHFDSMSLCLSKGVGAPIGSIVVGSAKFVDRVRYYRKLFGGGWRQAGFMAVAAKYAIDNIVPTMKETHKLAKYLADEFVAMGIDLQIPTHTNMVFIDTTRVGLEIERDLIPALAERNIQLGGMGHKARIVLHHQIDRQGVDTLLEVVRDAIKARQNLENEELRLTSSESA
ncbi:pyridoxal phosphate-dependent transferase [Cokeromyces recurvatus]|uniref:pyridoxal phosphate-dependent transferase n=1 Tax=Cokeromyces recurvatus TaxID=90255 RepID=UPI00221E4712|nr:pyridoxal phosphate-dependent transferase [Cokeromyces recurvatus]KAI7897985.1 pyridoxal phosphate-dependent transferase [Cokeromyces recurvatus]